MNLFEGDGSLIVILGEGLIYSGQSQGTIRMAIAKMIIVRSETYLDEIKKICNSRGHRPSDRPAQEA